MFHKGLNKEIIVNAAKELIEQSGSSEFSMRKLADKLEIKTASLYTHIESMEVLYTEVGLSALKQQCDYLLEAIDSKHKDSAVYALAEGYRRFAFEHTELYKLIMQIPSSNNETLKKAAAMTTEPFVCVLGDYDLSQEYLIHYERLLRATMHGFVFEELVGYFSHYSVSAEESYKAAIDCVINGLHMKEMEDMEEREHRG